MLEVFFELSGVTLMLLIHMQRRLAKSTTVYHTTEVFTSLFPLPAQCIPKEAHVQTTEAPSAHRSQASHRHTECWREWARFFARQH